MKKNESFNTAARLYDQMRPSYHPTVIEWIAEKTGIGGDDQLLEIGPGTGQATLPFAKAGFKIHGVELGDQMALLLREKCQGYPVTVDVSPFETWESDQFQHFQLIYCASAFHWLDKEVRYKKCAELLADQGYLALLWNEIPNETLEIGRRAFDLLKKYTGESYKFERQSRAERVQERINDINASGYFKFIEVYEYPFEIVQSSERFMAGFKTQSSYLSLEETAKEELSKELDLLIEEYTEPIKKNFVTTVYLAQKK